MTQSMPANPFNYLRSVPPAAFLGRWPLVRTIAQDLLGASDNSHAIIAGRRLGKTSLLRALEHQDVPADRTTEAEKLAKRVDALIEEVAKPDPDRVLVEAHTKDLTRVASVFQSILPAVVRIAGQIIALVTGIGS